MRKKDLRMMIGFWWDKLMVLSNFGKKDFIRIMEKDFLPEYDELRNKTERSKKDG